MKLECFVIGAKNFTDGVFADGDEISSFALSLLTFQLSFVVAVTDRDSSPIINLFLEVCQELRSVFIRSFVSC